MSGCCVSVAPMSSPPLLPPSIASFSAEVYFRSIMNLSAAAKSSNTFCFLVSMPARCHSSQYSPPPRRRQSANRPDRRLLRGGYLFAVEREAAKRARAAELVVHVEAVLGRQHGLPAGVAVEVGDDRVVAGRDHHLRLREVGLGRGEA